MTGTLADFRIAARTLTRSPAFTATAVLVLALGIGGTTTIFSFVNAVLLRPLPFSEPHRLVEIWGRDDRRTGMRVPRAILEALRERSKTLEVIGTHDPTGGVLNKADGPIDIRGETVSANFADVFGVQPFAGRAFVPDDERAGAPAVMLVSFSFWQRHLGGHRDIVGRAVYMDAVPYTVIGIMPAEFRTTFLVSPPDYWTAYAGNRSRAREQELGYEVVARLARDATVEQARREIEAIAAGVGVEEWRKDRRRIGLVPLTEEVVGDRAYALTLLLAAVAVVLAIACANLAQLMLARSERRLREFATRKAIGAPASQLFRLALSESLLLSLAGCVAGIVVAYWLMPVMLALAPVAIPRLVEASIDARVLAVALAISLLTGAVFGLAPALRLSRSSEAQAIKPAIGVPSEGRARFRSALVVVQVAGAVVLFVLAGLVMQTFLTLLPASPGFASEARAAFIWSLRENQFRDVAERRQRVGDWMQRLGAAAGIDAVAVASTLPFGDDESRRIPVRRPDDVRPAEEMTLRAEMRAVSDNYFRVLHIPVVRGRPLAPADWAEGPRVALVNETLARRLEPAGNVLGQSIRVGAAMTAPLYEIVGVVADTRWWGMTLDSLNEVYTPFAQDRAAFGFLVVQSRLDPTALTGVIRSAFHAAIPGAPLAADRRAIALDELIAGSVAGPRFNAMLIGSFSAMALIVAVIGLFGLVSYSVSQRRQELAVRTALGARPADLIRSSVRQATILTAIGIALGMAGAIYATELIRSQLYGVEPLDAITYAGAAVVMIVTAGMAAYLPARSAAYADAIAALRYE